MTKPRYRYSSIQALFFFLTHDAWVPHVRARAYAGGV